MRSDSPRAGNDKQRPFAPYFHELHNPFLERLALAGVTPEDVDFVLLTHLAKTEMTIQPLLFTNAAVYDGGDALRPASQILVADGLIQEVGDEVTKPASDCEVVDLGGRTLMPGLIDAHTHVWLSDLDLARATDRRDPYIAAFAFKTLSRMLDRGFTTVRDAGGTDVGFALALKDGLARGPRLLHAGRFISQTGGHFDVRRADSFSFGCSCALLSGSAARFACIADGADEVRRAVREELRKGAQQIKLMASGGVASPTDPLDRMQFSDAEIRAAVEEVERHGTYVMAHCHPASAIKDRLFVLRHNFCRLYVAALLRRYSR